MVKPETGQAKREEKTMRRGSPAFAGAGEGAWPAPEPEARSNPSASGDKAARRLLPFPLAGGAAASPSAAAPGPADRLEPAPDAVVGGVGEASGGGSANSTTAIPSASSNAVSNDSATRAAMSGRTTIRSTTTSMSWFSFLSSAGASSMG